MKAVLIWKVNMLFASTTISNGACIGVVTATGMSTEIGAIQDAAVLPGLPSTKVYIHKLETVCGMQSCSLKLDVRQLVAIFSPPFTQFWVGKRFLV